MTPRRYLRTRSTSYLPDGSLSHVLSGAGGILRKADVLSFPICLVTSRLQNGHISRHQIPARGLDSGSILRQAEYPKMKVEMPTKSNIIGQLRCDEHADSLHSRFD